MGFMESIIRFFNPDEAEARGRDLGRNDLCWCGSGKKYKKCHLDGDEQKIRAKSIQCGKS